jgi:hypothetical protein
MAANFISAAPPVLDASGPWHWHRGFNPVGGRANAPVHPAVETAFAGPPPSAQAWGRFVSALDNIPFLYEAQMLTGPGLVFPGAVNSG